MHRLSNRQIKVAILSLKHLQPTKKEQRPALTLKQLSYLTDMSISSLSHYFKVLQHVGIIEKLSCKECNALKGFAKGPKADQYLEKWGLNEQ
jgi:hypothetical protein